MVCKDVQVQIPEMTTLGIWWVFRVYLNPKRLKRTENLKEFLGRYLRRFLFRIANLDHIQPQTALNLNPRAFCE